MKQNISTGKKAYFLEDRDSEAEMDFKKGSHSGSNVEEVFPGNKPNVYSDMDQQREEGLQQ